MRACACGAGEDNCSEGLKKKFNEAGVSRMIWIQNGAFGMKGISGALIEAGHEVGQGLMIQSI